MDSAQNIPVRTCLDSAVDQRLRQLFMPISSEKQKDKGPRGTHFQSLYKLGSTLVDMGRSVTQNELTVTLALASPPLTGGVVVVLKQPSGRERFELGMKKTVFDSPTLTALDKAFRAVTCNSWSLRDVTIIDAFPFTRQAHSISSQRKTGFLAGSYRIIKEKRPDVILCMWQDTSAIGEDMGELRSLSIGAEYEESNLLLGPGYMAKRVNAFHPSYAVNHNPTFSCFRQLILLEITQAWHRFMGDWLEQDWMGQLRGKCAEKASVLCSM